MTSLLERIKGRREPTSAEIAKERLKLVLVSDRSDLSPEKLQELQTELIDVIKRYVHIDEMEVEIKFEQRDRKNYLVADIPLQRDHRYEAATEEGSAVPETPPPASDTPEEPAAEVEPVDETATPPTE
jgi:cell division topological specificity factor